MARVGSSKGVDLARTLKNVARSSRSGVLSVMGKDGTAIILLQAGGIVFASSDRVRPLGEHFVEKGLVSRETLDKVLMLQRMKKERQLLVGLLTEMNLVTRDVAASEIEDHIVEVLRDTLQWEEYETHFDPAQGDLDRIIFPPACGNVNVLLDRAST